MKFLALCAFAICSQVAAQQMYRCGNTFSQQPCEPNAVPLSQPSPAAGRARPNKPESGAASQISEAQRLDGLVADSQRDRRRQDLRERLLPEAEADLTGNRAACEQRQKDLAASQYAYKQNLYGKVHASQVASEMAAAAAMCDTKDRELKDRVDALAKECASMQCR
jgi:hypothetical protein